MQRLSLSFPSPSDSFAVSKTFSIALCLAATSLAIVSLLVFRPEFGLGMLSIGIAILCIVALLHGRFLSLAGERYRGSRTRLLNNEREVQSIFANAIDAILVFDSDGVCRDANPSAVTLLGARREKIVEQPIDLFFSEPGDFEPIRGQVIEGLQCQGEARLVRADGASISVDFSATRFLPGRHLIALRDTTERKRAKAAMNQSLTLARSSWQELNALKKATVALSEDFRMHPALDSVLETLRDVVPCELAEVLVLESDTRVFRACQAPLREASVNPTLGFPEYFEISDYPILEKVLSAEEGILLEDTAAVEDWTFSGVELEIRSWIGIRLVSSGRVLGILSLASSTADQLSASHLPMVRSLAVPAALAIRNARLYERAEIYGEELERRTSELRQFELARGAHDDAEDIPGIPARSSAVPMTIVSRPEGRIVGTNQAFERYSGFTLKELFGRRSAEFGLWAQPGEWEQLVQGARDGGRVRSARTRLKSAAGVLNDVLCSAEAINVEGQPCFLFVIDE